MHSGFRPMSAPTCCGGHVTVQAPGQAAIGDRLPVRNFRDQIPHATLRLAAGGLERQVELPPAAGQIFLELPCDLVESLVGAGAERVWVRPVPVVREVQAHHRPGVSHDGQVSEPRSQDRVPVHGLGAGHHRALFRSLSLCLEDARNPAIVRPPSCRLREIPTDDLRDPSPSKIASPVVRSAARTLRPSPLSSCPPHGLLRV